MFETTGLVDEKIIRSLKKYFMYTWQKIILITVVTFLTCMSLLFCFINCYIEASIIGMLGIFLVAEYFLIREKGCKICINRMEETNGSRKMKCMVSFDEQGCNYTNLNTGGTCHMEYSIFVTVIETKKVFAILTKSRQFFIVFKDDLDERQKQEFRRFILEHCEKVKKIHKA